MGDVQIIPHFKLEKLSPDFYMGLIENYIFHILEYASRFSYVKLRISSFMKDYVISDVCT